ncbi:MAG: RidA family protein [Alphaproteobacteria bacterium]|nr:RidA family protein [Alphaproteobacteria bacterium]
MSAQGGKVLSVAGQLATEKGGVEVPKGMPFAKQFAQCLRNVVDVVAADGGKPTDIAMMRAYVRDIQAFKDSAAEIRTAWMEILGKHFPAMTMVEVTMLFDPDAMIEIDALAVIQTA